MLVSRRGLALCASLSLLSALPATADAKRPKPHRRSHAHKAKPVKAPRADWDGDGLNNRYERMAGTKPRTADSNRNGVADGLEDRDGDGVTNHTEQLARTNPRKRDSNHNRIPDGSEDPDRDGLDNHGESLISTHPRKADTDGDGIPDGAEHAGVVSARSATTLTIALAAGGTLVAAINDDTDVTCDAPGQAGGSGSAPGAGGEDPAGSEDPAGGEDPGTGVDPGEDPPGEGEDPVDPAAEAAPAQVLRAGLGQSSAAQPAACVKVGDIVYQADVEDDGSGPVFTALDLLRPAAA